MDIQELRENVQKVISLREEVKDLKKDNRRLYSLKEYVGLFRDRLIFVDHGERDRFFLADAHSIYKIGRVIIHD